LLWSIEIYNLVFGKPAEAHKISDTYLFALWIIYEILFPLLFYLMKYIVEVRKDGIYTRLIPFNPSFKKIPYYMIEECKIQAYETFTGKYMDLSKSSKRNNLVVMLKLISGKKMLITSRKPEKLYRAITQAAAQQ
jgi:hypothetical protein